MKEGFKKNYALPRIESFIAQMSSDDEIKSFWEVLDCVSNIFPEFDQYFAGSGIGYLGFGKKEPNKRARPFLYLYRYSGELHFGINRKPSYLEKIVHDMSKSHFISLSDNLEMEEVKEWLNDFKDNLVNSKIDFKGGGRKPVFYANDLNLISEDIGMVMEDKDTIGKIIPLNQILYGAPGTGKTYNTINKALEIIDPVFLANNYDDSQRDMLKKRFDELVGQERIRFVTFHQSFSYEDFIEGISAKILSDEDQITDENRSLGFEIKAGIFKQICVDASRDKKTENDLGVRSNAKIWKISIGDEASREYCFHNDEARIGWGKTGNLSIPEEGLQSDYFKGLGSNDRNTLFNFLEKIQQGDILLCLKNANEISAVGVVSGNYEYSTQVPHNINEDYCHFRKVNWILKNIKFNILSLNQGVTLTLKTVYPLDRFDWPTLVKELEAQGYLINVPSYSKEKLPYVLIVDEINRGNISRIFGELITLIEESKREGSEEALSVILPYSKKRFSVPSNLYIIGTMNSSDRSLTDLDVALRRRFTFIEIQPDPVQLRGVKVDEIDIEALISVINQRVEILLDREYRIGHAYFMPLKKSPTMEVLSGIFRQRLLPLLQEYFFDDWEKINFVLGNNGMLRKKYDAQQISRLFPNMDLNLPSKWVVDDLNLDKSECYKAIYFGLYNNV